MHNSESGTTIYSRAATLNEGRIDEIDGASRSAVQQPAVAIELLVCARNEHFRLQQRVGIRKDE